MADDNGVQRKIGEHDASIATLREDMTELKADVKAILAKVNEVKGGWRVLLGIGAAGGAAGGFIAKYLPFLQVKP